MFIYLDHVISDSLGEFHFDIFHCRQNSQRSTWWPMPMAPTTSTLMPSGMGTRLLSKSFLVGGVPSCLSCDVQCFNNFLVSFVTGHLSQTLC